MAKLIIHLVIYPIYIMKGKSMMLRLQNQPPDLLNPMINYSNFLMKYYLHLALIKKKAPSSKIIGLKHYLNHHITLLELFQQSSSTKMNHLLLTLKKIL